MSLAAVVGLEVWEVGARLTSIARSGAARLLAFWSSHIRMQVQIISRAMAFIAKLGELHSPSSHAMPPHSCALVAEMMPQM